MLVARRDEMSKCTPEGIDILTDARHGWRKNSRQTDVVCLGGITKKVIRLETVTRADDSIAQRHEMIGTLRVYKHLKDHQVRIRRHCHDNNPSVTKELRDNQKPVVNQLDNWHGLKSLEKLLRKCAEGPKKNHDKVWHKELHDKVKSVRTHANYCMRYCDANKEKLQLLLIPVSHYQNDHQHCFPTARCRTDLNYEPSKIVITTEKAADLLEKAIRDSNLYKNAQWYIYNMSTAHVESFNNLLNVFQDKRIAFKHDTYMTRSKLAVCHWNENVGRESRKTHHPDGRMSIHYVHHDPSHNYCDTVWKQYTQLFV